MHDIETREEAERNEFAFERQRDHERRAEIAGKALMVEGARAALMDSARRYLEFIHGIDASDHDLNPEMSREKWIAGKLEGALEWSKELLTLDVYQVIP